jgi:hypothetical protein
MSGRSQPGGPGQRSSATRVRPADGLVFVALFIALLLVGMAGVGS